MPTVTATPTPTPACVVTNLGRLSAPFTNQRSSQAWSRACVSTHLPNRYARLYQFELREYTHVTIDLKSTRDAYLHLVKSGLVVAFDDNGYPATSTDSRIARVLDSGTYTIEASTLEESTTGLFNLTITGEEPIPLLGHQADHTVQYKIGSLPPTRTPAPTPTPFIGPVRPTPTPLPDPGVVIPDAIPTAVSAWNTAVAGSWPDVLFCERTPTTMTLSCLTPTPCPTRPFDDGDTVTIDAEDGGGLWRQATYIFLAIVRHCGSTTACVKPDPVTALQNLNPPRNGHMGSLRMVIEEPAWKYTQGGLGGILFGTHTRHYWTNNRNDHNTSVPGMTGTLFKYLPSVVMHEFGHAAGLDDLYKYPDPGYSGYLMDKDTGLTAVPATDINYLKQVYRNEHGSEPHEK